MPNKTTYILDEYTDLSQLKKILFTGKILIDDQLCEDMFLAFLEYYPEKMPFHLLFTHPGNAQRLIELCAHRSFIIEFSEDFDAVIKQTCMAKMTEHMSIYPQIEDSRLDSTHTIYMIQQTDGIDTIKALFSYTTPIDYVILADNLEAEHILAVAEHIQKQTTILVSSTIDHRLLTVLHQKSLYFKTIKETSLDLEYTKLASFPENRRLSFSSSISREKLISKILALESTYRIDIPKQVSQGHLIVLSHLKPQHEYHYHFDESNLSINNVFFARLESKLNIHFDENLSVTDISSICAKLQPKNNVWIHSDLSLPQIQTILESLSPSQNIKLGEGLSLIQLLCIVEHIKHQGKIFLPKFFNLDQMHMFQYLDANKQVYLEFSNETFLPHLLQDEAIQFGLIFSSQNLKTQKSALAQLSSTKRPIYLAADLEHSELLSILQVLPKEIDIMIETGLNSRKIKSLSAHLKQATIYLAEDIQIADILKLCELSNPQIILCIPKHIPAIDIAKIRQQDGISFFWHQAETGKHAFEWSPAEDEQAVAKKPRSVTPLVEHPPIVQQSMFSAKNKSGNFIRVQVIHNITPN